MPAQLLLIVFIFAPPGEHATLRAFERAARDVLGPRTVLSIERASSPELDERARDLAAQGAGVAQLSWSSDWGAVRIRAHLPRQRAWVERTIRFEAADPAEERGRLIGLAVASMFQDAPSEEAEAGPADDEEGSHAGAGARASAEPAAAPDEAQRAATGSVTGVQPDSVVNPPSRPPRTAGEQAKEATREGDVGARTSLELFGTGALGIGGSAEALGAGVALRVAAWERAWLRAGIAARGGSIPEALATTQAARLSVGAGFGLLPREARLGLSLRAEVFGGWFRVSRDSAAGEPTRRSREELGADLTLNTEIALGAGLAGVASVGLEAVAGATEIFTEGERMATVPPLRGVAELGVRLAF